MLGLTFPNNCKEYISTNILQIYITTDTFLNNFYPPLCCTVIINITHQYCQNDKLAHPLCQLFDILTCELNMWPVELSLRPVEWFRVQSSICSALPPKAAKRCQGALLHFSTGVTPPRLGHSGQPCQFSEDVTMMRKGHGDGFLFPEKNWIKLSTKLESLNQVDP